MSTNAITNAPDRPYGRAPGKLILSGEHAVVYGPPALAVAVERFTDVWFTPIHRSLGLRTAFENMSQGHFYPLDILKGFKDGLDQRFDSFLRGELPVQKILNRPDDLAVYTMASLMQMLPVPGVSSTLRLPVPGQINSRTGLPLGAGMGSSAAVIAATIILYEHLLGITQSLQERFEKVRFCERLQHGKGSSIDAASVIYGGLNRAQSGEVTPLEPGVLNKDGHGLYWVLHGTPQSSTGECVAAVRQHHSKDAPLWQAFEDCTNAFQTALSQEDNLIPIITENHRLLCQIGVVPESAQQFARSVLQAGGAAKISGAGSIRGDQAGAILVHMPDPDVMTDLMSRHPTLEWAPLCIARQGAQLIDPHEVQG